MSVCSFSYAGDITVNINVVVTFVEELLVNEESMQCPFKQSFWLPNLLHQVTSVQCDLAVPRLNRHTPWRGKWLDRSSACPQLRGDEDKGTVILTNHASTRIRTSIFLSRYRQP